MAAIRKLASRADVIHMSLMRLLGKRPKPHEHIAGDMADLSKRIKKNDNDYDFFRYDGEYFSKILEERISHSFDNESKEVTFTIDNEKPLEYKKVIDTNEELENIIWSDIIRVRMIDKKPYLSAPSGFIYKEIPMPDYDQAVEVIAPIEINKDLNVSIGDIAVVNDPNDLNEIRRILGLPKDDK